MLDTLDLARKAVRLAEEHLLRCRERASQIAAPAGKVDLALADKNQRALHALAWTATTVKALTATCEWAERLESEGKFSETENLIVCLGFSEYLAQLAGGIPMSQNEIARPCDLGLEMHPVPLAELAQAFFGPNGGTALREKLGQHVLEGNEASDSTGDDELDMVREQFRRFTDERIAPNAHRWHLDNTLIPDTKRWLGLSEQFRAFR